MGNGTARKKTPAGMVVLQGVLVSLAIYLLAAVVLALLAVKGVMPEKSLFPALAVCCGVCALAGGMACARRVPWGALPGAMAAAAGFGAVLAAVGLLCWTDGVTWTGRGGILLACVLGGGLLAGLLGRRRGGRRVQKGEGLLDRLRSGRPSFLFLGSGAGGGREGGRLAAEQKTAFCRKIRKKGPVFHIVLQSLHNTVNITFRHK